MDAEPHSNGRDPSKGDGRGGNDDDAGLHGTPPAVAQREAEVTALENEIAELCAHLFAGTARLLALINAWEERECGNHRYGLKSTAHWLSWRCGVGLGPAREYVRVARALKALPLTTEAFSRGMLSYCKVRAITRVANPRNERALVLIARHATGAQLERITRAYRRVEELNDPERLLRQQRRRGLTTRIDDDGMLLLQGRFTPEDGATLVRCLEAMESRMAEETRDTDADDPPAARRADALLRLVESGAHGEPQPLAGGERVQVVLHVPVSVTDPHTAPPPLERRVAAETPPSEHEQSRPTSDADRSRARKISAETPPRVNAAPRDSRTGTTQAPSAATPPAHAFADAQPDALERPAAPSPPPPPPPERVPHLDPGPAISWETTRRLACDANRVLLRETGSGQPLAIGRKSRTVPPAMRRALGARDDGCRFPGCTERRFVDAHHIVHWADGGATELDNLVLLCRYHHVLVHEKGFGCQRTERGEVAFTTPAGSRMPAAGELPALFEQDVRRGLEARNHRRGIHVTAHSCWSLSGGGRYDLHWVVEGLYREARHGPSPIRFGDALDERFPPPAAPGPV